MNRLRIFTVKVFVTAFFLSSCAFADDFIFSDWGEYSIKCKERITSTSDKITYERVRKEQNFDKFFDKQSITIYKNKGKITPQQAGEMYLSSVLNGKVRSEKYILKDTKSDFFACYCSHEAQKCEIIRYYNGFDGLVEVKYTHNNLWHFQNNIGSFIAIQTEIKHVPYEFDYIFLLNGKRIVRL